MRGGTAAAFVGAGHVRCRNTGGIAPGRGTGRGGWERLVNSQAVLLMAGPTVLRDELHRLRVTEAELRARLRQSGIRSDREVAAVILEPTGTISVLRRGILRMLIGLTLGKAIVRPLPTARATTTQAAIEENTLLKLGLRPRQDQ
ncbi:YetF domain-containing protein [Georgenia sp. AZ-5]|uniref:YetF domain-containing protein n=1 Tax=Georgenia sp. AZ-5 TaxID=3367526 RepID=UPI003754D1FB